MGQEASMVSIGTVGPATIVGSAFRQGPTAEGGAAPAHRALVRITPVPPQSGASLRPAAGGRAAAPFLAHLIATVQDAPQTRERRRADPNWATTTYAAMMQVPVSAGQAVRQSR
jgi:hypothetical protein